MVFFSKLQNDKHIYVSNLNLNTGFSRVKSADKRYATYFWIEIAGSHLTFSYRYNIFFYESWHCRRAVFLLQCAPEQDQVSMASAKDESAVSRCKLEKARRWATSHGNWFRRGRRRGAGGAGPRRRDVIDLSFAFRTPRLSRRLWGP